MTGEAVDSGGLALGEAHISGVTEVQLQRGPRAPTGRVTAADYVVGVSGGSLGNLEAGALGSLTSPVVSALAGGLVTVAGAAVIGLALPAFTRYRRQPRADR